MENLKRTCRKSKLARVIVQKKKEKKGFTTKAILKILDHAAGNMWRQTMQRILHAAGVHGSTPKIKLFLRVRTTKTCLDLSNSF